MRALGKFLRTHKTLFLSLGLLVLFAGTVTFATPPGTKYNPGETLDPNCAPGSSNCTVNIASGGSSQWDDVTGGINYAGGKVGVGTTAPKTALDLEGDGAILAIGTLGSGATAPNLGAGTRMMWIPRLGAFRAGTVLDTLWDNSNVGQYSVAFGSNNRASGPYSVAFGSAEQAYGQYSVGFGSGNYLADDYSMAMGASNYVSSGYTFVAGAYNTVGSASNYSTVLGSQNNIDVNSYYNTVFGQGNSTSSINATAFGVNNVASGGASTAFGNTTVADSYNSTALGRYNVGGGDSANWIGTDPLFEIGNGDPTAGSPVRADAFRILKNGNTTIYGNLNVTGAVSCGSGCSGGGSGGNLTLQTNGHINDVQSLLNLIAGSNITLTDDGSGNVTIASGGGGGSQWDDVSGGIQYTGGDANLDNGAFTVGNNIANDGGSSGLSFAGISDLSTGGVDANGISLGVVSDPNLTESSIWDSSGSSTAWSTIQQVNDNAGNSTYIAINNDPTDEFILLSNSQGHDTALHPTISDGSTPFLFDTSITHTSGDLFDINNAGTPELTFDNAGNLFVQGNITCGGTCGSGGGGSSQWDDVTGGINYAGGFVGVGTTTPQAALDLEGDGTILAVGTQGSGAAVPDLGTGTRLMWIPSKAAFRAGIAGSTTWDDANVGLASTAFGFGNTASGSLSTAFGEFTNATGGSSTTFGFATTANGTASVAFGGSNLSSGNYSASFGENTIAAGEASVALGLTTTADSLASFALGRYNVGGGTGDTWIDTDPLFEIGNGADGNNHHDALEVLKNGNTVINGDLTVNGNIFCTGGTCDAGAGGTGGTTLFETNGFANGSQVLYNLVAGTGITLTDDGNGNVTVASSGGGGSSQWNDVSGGIQYTGGDANLNNGAFTVGSNIANDWGSINGSATLIGIHDVSTGDNDDNEIFVGSTSDPSFSNQYSDFDTFGSTSTWLTTQVTNDGSSQTYIQFNTNATQGQINLVSSDGTNNASFLVSSTSTDVNLQLSTSTNGVLTTLNPTSADGNSAYTFDTSIAHTTGYLFNVNNQGDLRLTLDYAGNFFAQGNITAGGGSASGLGSIAVGGVATGIGSAAFGGSNNASADYSTVFGNSNTASANAATAFGIDTIASGEESVAFGISTTASNEVSLATGFVTTSSGFASASFNRETTASGTDSSSFGDNTLAEARDAFAIGSYNIGGGNPTEIDPASPIFEIGNGQNIASVITRSDAFIVLRNGNTGIALDPASSNPTHTLDVGSSAVSGVVARFINSAGTCDINPTTSSLTCSSDMNLKKNITNLADNSNWSFNNNISVQNQSVLNELLALNPVNYNWKTEAEGSTTHDGFIAQEVQQVFPNLVSTDPTTHLLSLNYTGLIPYTVEAIKEMNVNITSIDDLTKQNSWRDALLAWFADKNNGIKNIFSDTVKTNNLCVGTTCVTQQQFLQMVNNSNASATPISGGSTTTPPADNSDQSPEVTPPIVTPPSDNSQSPDTVDPVITPPTQTPGVELPEVTPPAADASASQ